MNMQGLLNVLDLAVKYKLRVFWPSSIAIYNQSKQEPTTVYGISKLAGEHWCNYYNTKYGADVRSLRYPELISYSAPAGGGTTDYAVDIFHKAVAGVPYQCFLSADTELPMMYMPDAVRATIRLMEADPSSITIRTSYDTTAMSFTPAQLANAIQNYLPDFTIIYKPDHRQAIADSWPSYINDKAAFID